MPKNYSQFVGIRLGYNWWFATLAGWPGCVKLEVTMGALILRMWNQICVIPKESIAQIVRTDGILSTGFRIEHSVHNLVPYVVIKPFSARSVTSLERELVHYGYKLVKGSS